MSAELAAAVVHKAWLFSELMTLPCETTYDKTSLALWLLSSLSEGI